MIGREKTNKPGNITRVRICVFVCFLVCVALGFGRGTALYGLDIHRDIVQKAQRYVGNGYCRGGISPPCFDCSGFVGYILEPHVSGLPRVSRDMAAHGTRIGRTDLRPGDLVFFATTPHTSVVSHVAIYIGQDSIIHAISDGPNRGVNVTSLTSRYWRNHYHSASRVLQSAAQEGGAGPSRTDEPIRFAKGTYTGELAAGEPHGEGTLQLDNGDVYRGRFVEGSFDGRGTYTWTDGSRYEGEFDDGRIEGKGLYISAEGTRTSGTWRNGELVKPEKPAEKASPALAPSAEETRPEETYMEKEDSPWDTWEGVITGDYYAWREQEKESFEEFKRSFDEWKKKNQP